MLLHSEVLQRCPNFYQTQSPCSLSSGRNNAGNWPLRTQANVVQAIFECGKSLICECETHQFCTESNGLLRKTYSCTKLREETPPILRESASGPEAGAISRSRLTGMRGASRTIIARRRIGRNRMHRNSCKPPAPDSHQNLLCCLMMTRCTCSCVP
jgi:hypothetical protein